MTDPRELPAYTVSEAARYLRVPAATVRHWSMGRDRYPPLITVPDGTPTAVSFLNLAELHVLAALRREDRGWSRRVRETVSNLESSAQTRQDRQHPLLSRTLEIIGLDLAGHEHGQPANTSEKLPEARREIVREALRRIEPDRSGMPVRIYPFTRPELDAANRVVVIDPRLSRGRPVLAGTGLATRIIAERYKLGESIDELASDYERPESELEEAIRWELWSAA